MTLLLHVFQVQYNFIYNFLLMVLRQSVHIRFIDSKRKEEDQNCTHVYVRVCLEPESFKFLIT